MSANAEFIEYVRGLFVPLGELSDGGFFGGFAFKRDSKQFAMIMGNTLYFCVNDKTRPNYEVLEMEPFSYTTKKGKIMVRKYYAAPEHLFEDRDELVVWANEAIDAARSY